MFLRLYIFMATTLDLSVWRAFWRAREPSPGRSRKIMAAKGLLLINLGSPSAPTTSAVAKFLREFLHDPHVIDLPAVLRYPLVSGVIIPMRASRSARAYAKIWTAQGSPLVTHTRAFAESV